MLVAARNAPRWGQGDCTFLGGLRRATAACVSPSRRQETAKGGGLANNRASVSRHTSNSAQPANFGCTAPNCWNQALRSKQRSFIFYCALCQPFWQQTRTESALQQPSPSAAQRSARRSPDACEAAGLQALPGGFEAAPPNKRCVTSTLRRAKTCHQFGNRPAEHRTYHLCRRQH